MALDIGERRIGIAVSESGVFATPHSVFSRKSKKEDFARVQHLIDELKIERVIVGLPYSLSGSKEMGPQARRIKRYAEALAKAVTAPIDFVDESYSTADAEIYRALSRRKSNRRVKAPIDDVAAAVILQRYLDTTRRRSAE